MNREERSGQEWARPVDDAGPDPNLDDAVRRVLANARERSTESESLFGPYQHWTRQLFAECPEHAFKYANAAQKDRDVLSHARALLAEDGTTSVITADVRTPGVILAHPDLTDLIDFDRPVGVLMFAVLHFVADADDPYGIVNRFRDVMAPGSYLGLSHAVSAPGVDEAAAMYTREATESGTTRTTHDITRFFDGLTVVNPGVVPVNRWQRRSTRADVCLHGGIATKPTEKETV